MLLYTQKGERRSWLYGLLALFVVICNYLLYPWRYGLSPEWDAWQGAFYSEIMLIAVYLSLASIMVTTSSLRIGIVIIALAGVYLLYVGTYKVVLSGVFPPDIPVDLLISGVGMAAATSLFCAMIEGTLWAWRDPRKKF